MGYFFGRFRQEKLRDMENDLITQFALIWFSFNTYFFFPFSLLISRSLVYTPRRKPVLTVLSGFSLSEADINRLSTDSYKLIHWIYFFVFCSPKHPNNADRNCKSFFRARAMLYWLAWLLASRANNLKNLNITRCSKLRVFTLRTFICPKMTSKKDFGISSLMSTVHCLGTRAIVCKCWRHENT